MFKKSLLVALLLSTMTVLAVSEETVEVEQEVPASKCDILYDECITKCGENATEACTAKCEAVAEECDQVNAPAVEE
jgi:uncharacterized pyridoxal phosphate-containing UPF0001 family protein